MVVPAEVQVPRTDDSRAEKAPRFFLPALFLGSFGIHVALMSPVYVSLQLKAQEIAGAGAVDVIGSVLSVGALGALFANPIAGALSDRTRTRWGRRRPWLYGGSALLILVLWWISAATSKNELIAGWLAAQIIANATLAPFMASFADNVPRTLRGRASSVLWLSNNVSILAGTYLSVYLVSNLPVLFIAPGFLGLALMLVYGFVARDEVPETRLPAFTLKTLAGTFWVNPVKHSDFTLVWLSRLFIVLANFMFVTFRLLYMQDHLGMSKSKAISAVAFGVLLYTIALLIGTAFSGWLSDRLQRRKLFVGGSTLLFGVGMVVLARADSVNGFYTAEAVMGLAYGVYLAVDQALVVDVLPDGKQSGKDLGVINIAMALPQSLAPVAALALLKVGSPDAHNYPLMLWGAALSCLVGALLVLPIKRVR
ncbi:MFS transporter [Streptomyces sp. NPDC090499]|uniref:MFS transporter n=1 Tax=Streptomyces sp. NPDC090499 TaxID=3365965 RepID=UPI0037F65A74